MSRLFTGIYLDRRATRQGLKSELERAINDGAKSLLILAAEHSHVQASEYAELLSAVSLPVFGGVFPRLIYENECLESGHLICALDYEPDVVFINHLSRRDHAQLDALLSPQIEAGEEASYLFFLDGLSSAVDCVVERLYFHLGPRKTVVGGGAGYSSLAHRPCVMTNEGLIKDAALLIRLDHRMKIQVGNGWQKTEGPFLVTQSQKNVVHTLNYRPAFTIYKEVLDAMIDEELTADNFQKYAKHFPLGKERIDGELIIRDPIHVIDEALVCVGSVSKYSMVYVMSASNDQLIDAAGDMAEGYSKDNVHSAHEQSFLVFDCVSRMFCLGNDFASELARIRETIHPDLAMVGALTLGEIANAKSGMIQLHNKTIVMSASEDVFA